ncbi:hypothetical protein GCM10027596_09940 [Nocardioides korecus]
MIAGRYSLEREVGRGGTGAVWLARDEVLGRSVALKRIGLLPGVDQTDLARAEREARLSARLNHPHVVSVFDVVTDRETDTRWLVMEYVDGVTLAQMVRERGHLSPDEAAPLLQQVSDALAAAHASGIVHRDVKPSNVLVDRVGRAKLTDFGIARIATDAALTQTGMVTGSPAYLAPEVATGGRGEESSDVWSLGATLFHLLEGRPPYDMGANVLGGLYRMVNEEPPRPQDAGWMTPLVESTMVRDPELRWTMPQVRDFLASRGRDAPAVPTPTRSEAEARGAATDEPTVAIAPAAAAAAAAAAARADTTADTPAHAPDEPPVQIAPTPPGSGGGSGRSGRGRAPRRATRDRAAAGGAASARAGSRGPSTRALVAGAALVVVLLIGGYALLTSGGSGGPGGSAGSSGSSGSPSPSASASASSSPSASATPTRPTAAGMKSFISDYVRLTGEDPSRSWQLLTPKFQRQSGGFARYRQFWDSASNGRVLSIQANPSDLTVSYQVRFDNFANGPGPTVLKLKYTGGKYLIDGESSKGFTPAG